MVRAVTQAISNGWLDHEAQQGISLVSDIEHFLLDVPAELYASETVKPYVTENAARWELRETAPEVFGLESDFLPGRASNWSKT